MEDVRLQELEGLRAQLDMLRSLVDGVPAMLAYCDASKRCRFVNRAYKTWFGAQPEDAVGKEMPESLAAVYSSPYIEGALRGEPQTFERELPDPAGGPPRYSQAHYVPHVVSGSVRGMFLLVADITEQKKVEESLRKAKEKADAMATHDPLTGLPNRLLLEDRIGRAIEVAKRNKGGCGVLFLDLDDFKHVNDAFGHFAGDALLREVARRLVGALRKSDTVARVGGDEFIVLAPELDSRERAGEVAQKLLTAMAREPFLAPGKPSTVSVSIGVALYPTDGTDAHDLIAHADAALYEAKRAGRNGYSVFAARRR